MRADLQNLNDGQLSRCDLALMHLGEERLEARIAAERL
jgi:hypothetical protein